VGFLDVTVIVEIQKAATACQINTAQNLAEKLMINRIWKNPAGRQFADL